MRLRMRHFTGVAIAATLAACGTPSVQTSTTSTAAATNPPPVGIEALLLDAADVGPRWTLAGAVNTDDFASFTQTPCAIAPLDADIAARLTPTAGVQFEPTDGSYKHLLEMLVTGAPAQLDIDLRALLGTSGTCSHLPSTTTDEGEVVVGDLVIPAFGDQRYAYVLLGREAATSDTTWHVREAVVRVGSVVVNLGLTEIVTAPQQTPTITDAEFARLVEVAVAKAGSFGSLVGD